MNGQDRPSALMLCLVETRAPCRPLDGTAFSGGQGFKVFLSYRTDKYVLAAGLSALRKILSVSGLSGNECLHQLATSVMDVGWGSDDKHDILMYESRWGRGQRV